MNKINREKSYFTIIPNIVDDLLLSPQAVRLYLHIKRVAGDNGLCWQSGATMAEICQMSTGSISNSKQELEKAGLITVTNKVGDTGNYAEIEVNDIWIMNHEFYLKPDSSSQSEEGSSYIEEGSSYIETKKNPINNNPVNEPVIYSKPKPEKKNKKLTQKDYDSAKAFTYSVIENSDKSKTMAFTQLPEVYIPFAKAFTESTGIQYLKRYFSDWCGTFEDWISLGYQPVDITSAIEAIIDEGKGGLVSRPGSIDWKLRAMIVEKKNTKKSDPYANFKDVTE